MTGKHVGPNQVEKGELVDITKGSSRDEGAEVADSAHHLLEDEALVDDILSNEVPTEEYYQCFREFLRSSSPGARASVLEHLSELVELFDGFFTRG